MSAVQPVEDGCRACSAPTDLFLCSRCVTELRRMFTALFRGPWVTAANGTVQSGGRWMIERPTPGLLEHLSEAAIGQVRIETGGGRRTRRAGLVQYTDPKPATDGLGGTEGQRRLEQDAENGNLALSSVLRQGKLNPKAINLLESVNEFLADCVNTLATYGVKKPPEFAAVPRNSLPASFDMAEWLSRQMAAIPLIDKAGWMYNKLERLTRQIEKTIDRPEPLRTCGPCPTLVGHHEECGTALEAKHDQREVTCPVCEQTYDVEKLISAMLNQSDDMLMTIRELVDWVLPKLEELVPQKTLENWVNRGWLEVRGHNDAGAQMVRLGDVREIRRSRPRFKKAS